MAGSNKESRDDQPNLADLITLSQAAAISGLTVQHLARLIRAGTIWGSKLNSPSWFTTETAVREYLARERKPGPKPKNKA